MITLSKIAKLAHVSVSTASKAFSMSSDVSEQTRQEIFRIAKEYGCFKKFYNAKYPKYVIAVICPEFHSQHYAGMLAFLQESLHQHNCDVCVASTNFQTEVEENLLEYYHNYANVDGIVIIGGRVRIPESYELPVVSITPACLQTTGVRIKTSYRLALSQAIDHLVSNGLRRISYIGEPLASAKFQRFCKLMEEKGLTSDHVIISHERFETGGYLAMQQLLSRETLPQAVICAYDHMAIGAMKAIAEHGLSIPSDIAIMGMDNIPSAEFLTPGLSSIDFRTEEVCQRAANVIVDLLSGKQVESELLLQAELKLRASTQISKE